MVDRQERYLYMLEIFNKDGGPIETTTFVTKHNDDTMNWRVWELIDQSKYNFHLTYLGIQGKKRNLVKLEANI